MKLPKKQADLNFLERENVQKILKISLPREKSQTLS